MNFWSVSKRFRCNCIIQFERTTQCVKYFHPSVMRVMLTTMRRLLVWKPVADVLVYPLQFAESIHRPHRGTTVPGTSLSHVPFSCAFHSSSAAIPVTIKCSSLKSFVCIGRFLVAFINTNRFRISQEFRISFKDFNIS